MAITMNCPGCGGLAQLGDELAGKKVRCQKCQTVFEVLAPTPAPAEPPAVLPPAQALLVGPPPQAPEKPPESAPAESPPAREAVTEAAPKGPSRPPPLRPGRSRDDEDDDGPRRRRRQQTSAGRGGLWGLLFGVGGLLLLGTCCIGTPILGGVFWFMARSRHVEKVVPGPKVDGHVEGKKDFGPIGPIGPIGPPPNKEKGGEKDQFKDKDGPAPPAPLPPPVPVKFDGKGVFEMQTSLQAQDADPRDPNRCCKRFQLDARAETAYVIDMPDQLGPGGDFNVRAEPAGGGPPIQPKEQGGGVRNQLAFFAEKGEGYVVFVSAGKHEANRGFTFRIREWDESEPVPEHLKMPAPLTAIPKVEVALQAPNQMFTGGAFSPDNKFFWTANSDATVTLWEHANFEKKGSYRLPAKKWLHALAVDGKGRLYAQSMPSNQATISLAKPVVGPIEVYEDLKPKGDSGELPAPTKLIELRGIVRRIIPSADGRWVYFLDTHNRKLGRIDSSTGAVDKTIDDISSGTVSFCLTPGGKKIYCCSNTNRIDVIDAEAFKLEKSVTLAKGQPIDIAATDGGIVFMLGMKNEGFPFSGNCYVLDVSKKLPDRAPIIPVRCGHHGSFLQMAPDQKTVFISGDRRVSACPVPARPALFQTASRDHHVKDFFTPGWIQISPDGRTLLHDVGAVLSVSR